MLWVLVLLGLIQGLTEFLPVSSSGHLVLLYNIFGINGDNLLLSILLHVATLLSVVITYRKDLCQLIKHPFCKTNINLIIATIPTVLIVLFFKDIIDILFGGELLVFSFLLTALLLVISEFMSSKYNFVTNNTNVININIKWWQALLIGVSQGIAVIPGLSRSGTTISTALISGIDKENATKFSFILSIPVIIGSLIFEIMQGGTLSIDESFWSVGLGFLVAFVIGMFAIKVMQKLVAKSKLYYFSYYLLVLSAVIVVFNLV